MNTKAGAHHGKGTSQAAGDPASHEAPHKDHFLQLMFFQASHEPGDAASPGMPPPPARAGDFSPLRSSRTAAGVRCALPMPGTTAPLRLDSPAVEVMTDLRKVPALTIGAGASIAEANRVMIARSVRALFVTDDARDLLVHAIMTPADRLEVLDLRDLEHARVGDVVATLKFSGRQHALVAETLGGEASGPQTICGIISLTQIGRRLGIPQQQVHDIARTFAEIEALIAAN
jgi:hypothetical protein